MNNEKSGRQNRGDNLESENKEREYKEREKGISTTLIKHHTQYVKGDNTMKRKRSIYHFILS